MLDDARYRVQRSRQARRIGYSSKMGIDNPVAAIGDKNVAVLALSDHHLPGNATFRKCLGHRAPGRGQAERNDLDRQRKAAETFDPFGFIGDHDHAIRGRGHDLFPQQRAAAALDEIERGIDLVGAIDRQIEPVDVVERGQAEYRTATASARVASEVGTPMTSSPARTRSPSSSTKCFAVEPVPSPSLMPSRTCSSARGRGLPFQFVHGHAQRIPLQPPPIGRPAMSGGAYLASFYREEQRYTLGIAVN